MSELDGAMQELALTRAELAKTTTTLQQTQQQHRQTRIVHEVVMQNIRLELNEVKVENQRLKAEINQKHKLFMEETNALRAEKEHGEEPQQLKNVIKDLLAQKKLSEQLNRDNLQNISSLEKQINALKAKVAAQESRACAARAKRKQDDMK
jgi:hypothetical protein